MLSTDSINTTVGDFQRGYLYKITCPTVPIGLPSIYPKASSFAANMDLYATKFQIPESSTNPIQIKWSGMWVWFSGPQNPAGNVTLGLRCDKNYDARGFFRAWKTLTGDDATGVSFPKSLCVGELDIAMVDVDKTTVLQIIKLKQVQIMKVEATDLEKAGEAIMEFNVVAHYEQKYELTPPAGTTV